MTEPAPAWSSRRWIGLTVLLAALHAGGFWLVARFPAAPAPKVADAFRLVWSPAAPDPLEGLLVSPTRFALPGEGGFSGDASRALPPVAYGWGSTEPRPSFLAADPDGSQLGPAPALPPPPARDPMPRGPMPPADPVPRMTLDEAQVEIELHGEVHHIACGGEESLLEAALRHKLPAPYSCQAGLCAACMCRVVEGQVHMRHNEALDARDLRLGWVLGCQSVPRTAVVKVKYP